MQIYSFIYYCYGLLVSAASVWLFGFCLKEVGSVLSGGNIGVVYSLYSSDQFK